MVTRNGVGTFAALKRELSSAARAGSIRSIGEVVALRALLLDERVAMLERQSAWKQRQNYIERALYDAGAEVDSLMEDHAREAYSLIHDLWVAADRALGRDLSKIEAFLDSRGVSY